ncbi:MAG: DUF3576 domain-containing protein [Alkalilacustris sp.]
MATQRVRIGIVTAGLALGLAACGGGLAGGGSGDGAAALDDALRAPDEREIARSRAGTIWDLFTNAETPGATGQVNRYLWTAALEVLDFLPVETVDPFSGVIVTGFGQPPGGGREYRAAVLVSDPALDARSINVALMTRAGPASPATIRAVEDAIMTRARQLRVRDGRL